MLPRTFHGWAAALAVSIFAQAAPASAQTVTVWENVHLTQILVNNMDATDVVVDFDAQVCANGSKVAVIARSLPEYSFLVSIAMAALSSNRRLHVHTHDVSAPWCHIDSFTLLK